MPTVRSDREPGVDYKEHEFCLLLAGRARLTEEGGSTDEYGMGDGSRPGAPVEAGRSGGAEPRAGPGVLTP